MSSQKVYTQEDELMAKPLHLCLKMGMLVDIIIFFSHLGLPYKFLKFCYYIYLGF